LLALSWQLYWGERMGGFSTVSPSSTNIAQTVWSYGSRTLTDIQSLVNAIQNNNPNLLSSLSDILYVPAPYYAGQVSATQVAAFLSELTLNYGLAGPVAAAISASPYGLWSTNFVAQVVIPYLDTTTLNLILSSGQMDANHAQLILYNLVQNYYYNKWIYTITANAPSSITFSTNTVLNENVLVAQNITVASGATVTCGTQTCFFVAQSFNNYGTIVNPYGAPGGVPPPGGGTGGTGGGGIVVIAITAVLGTLNVNGNPGANAFGYSGAGTGGAGVAGIFYVVTGVTVPLGGTGGYGTNGLNGAAGINGGGGGGSDNTTMGAPGGGAAVYSFSSPNAMVTYILQGISDWWITRMTGRAPSYATPLAYMYGSGGGAGAVWPNSQSGGGGGGGGGEVVVYGYNVVSGTINAAGGNGGAEFSAGSAYYAGGGGGGGGGLAFIFYGATSGTVTANVSGGAGGTGYGASGYNTPGTEGSTGANGTLYIAAVTVNG
jgi:hypothetical protein